MEEEKPMGSSSYSLLKSIAVSGLGKKQLEEEEKEDSLLCNLREVQCLICCHLHQMFIADPNIAKLVHFQVRAGSPRSGGDGGHLKLCLMLRFDSPTAVYSRW